MPVEEQVAIIYTVTNGYLDDIPVESVSKFEREFLNFLRNSSHKEILTTIKTSGNLDEATEEKLKKAILEFKETFRA